MRETIGTGDIVIVDGPGLNSNGCMGTVVQVITYRSDVDSFVRPNHRDEYSCKLKLFGDSEQNTTVVRAKWLKILSKAKEN